MSNTSQFGGAPADHLICIVFLYFSIFLIPAHEKKAVKERFVLPQPLAQLYYFQIKQYD